MKVLIVNAFAPELPGRSLVDTAVATLAGGGHDVRRSDLVDGGFSPFMTTEERLAYHGDDPVVNNDVADEVASVRWAGALLFCYPTVTFTVPAVLKGWLDRVLVPGVAFDFDARGRVRPALTNVRRLGAVTTTTASRWRTWQMRDGGRRTITRTVRLNCNRRCRVTWIAVRSGSVRDGSESAATRVAHELGGW